MQYEGRPYSLLAVLTQPGGLHQDASPQPRLLRRVDLHVLGEHLDRASEFSSGFMDQPPLQYLTLSGDNGGSQPALGVNTQIAEGMV